MSAVEDVGVPGSVHGIGHRRTGIAVVVVAHLVVLIRAMPAAAGVRERTAGRRPGCASARAIRRSPSTSSRCAHNRSGCCSRWPILAGRRPRSCPARNLPVGSGRSRTRPDTCDLCCRSRPLSAPATIAPKSTSAAAETSTATMSSRQSAVTQRSRALPPVSLALLSNIESVYAAHERIESRYVDSLFGRPAT